VAHPLDGALLRVKRAEKRLGDLQAGLSGLTEAERDAFDRTVLVVDKETKTPKEGRKLIEALHPKPKEAPPIFSVLVGETVYNLRAALDYLIYALAEHDFGKPVAGTQFPIEDTPHGFAGRKKTYLGGVNAAHIAAIEQLQPYKGCDWTRRLRSISNPDKHRHLTSVQNRNDVQSVFVQDPNNTIYSAQRFGPGEGKMYVRRFASVQVVFNDGKSVIETLQILQSEVGKTLLAFKPEF
jgi:hypothetical protein